MLMRSAVVAAGLVAVSMSGADAYEFGFAGSPTKPSVTIGPPAAAPPVGLYAFDLYFDYAGRSAGAPGGKPDIHLDYLAHGFVWSPGWTFLGGQYSGLLVAHYGYSTIGDPAGQVMSGFHDPFMSHGLSWKLGDSGFFVKTAFGMYMPLGTQQGPAGLNNNGNPWWTLVPTVVVSYLNNGWNLTANIYDEINTQNTITKYRTGDILHAEFTAVKTIGKWKIGPVGYYFGQISNDHSSDYYHGAIAENRYNVWAAGGLVGYDFGPFSVDVWATKDVYAKAWGGNSTDPMLPSNTVPKGLTVLAQFNYRLWAPGDDSPTPKLSGFHK